MSIESKKDVNEDTKQFNNLDPLSPPSDPPLLPGWTTLSQLAKETGYSRLTLRNLCKNGDVLCYNLEKSFWLIERKSFEQYRSERGRGKYNLKNLINIHFITIEE